ncbi:MAG TPA: permease-like cell division protein FtsX [Candidatus Paceibacterota bacterium]|nr:permease-like cell division protein FtsX [Candidatus Paceibacterota bacterium]
MSFWLNIKRVARYGLIGFIRNGFVSLSAVLIMTITLLVVSGLMISGAALNATLQQLTNKVDVNVYFITSASDAQITDMQKMLEALPEVASVSYLSREEALAQFRERHKNDQLTIQALDELSDNPLGASLEVRAKETSQYESIAKFLEAQQAQGTDVGGAIDKVNFYQNKTAIDRLTNIIDASKRLGAIIAVVLALATILISLNTVRLAIYTSRNEIGVMNIVGASRWYVRGPFMVAGVLYGVISGAIVLILLYPISLYISPALERFLGTFNAFSYYADNFPFLFLVVIGSGIALGALSSYIAVRRYLQN